MASSSDWLTALLERPADEQEGAKPLDWLPDFGKSGGGFVERLPFDRPAPEPETSQPVDGSSVAETGDELEDILRKALANSEEQAASGSEATPEPMPEATQQLESKAGSEPEPDPVAEAFARGEAAGKQAAIAEQQALAEQKVSLRQTFRSLDQAAMDALAADLSETVIALCSQALADFIPAPEALKQRCQKAAQRLGAGAVEATLHLHPDDLLLIDRADMGGWKIVGDPTVERGGLRFETRDGSVSDSPADWRRAIAAALRG